MIENLTKIYLWGFWMKRKFDKGNEFTNKMCETLSKNEFDLI